ncbi:MAG: UDP-N-acetylmuramoyl-tripeptide--D-alanyl-D-alanine ligase [Clostridiales bacterium]|nr:UDP-N-acetylmuramoyl-tripeptide--D-alanyl-D-alanine ligase [Clostridiales bacterium]
MKNMTLIRMAGVCGGTYYGRDEDREREICSVMTDSRKAEPGCLFAAIKGERVDGHDFIPAVLEKGALCVITEREPEELEIQTEKKSTDCAGKPSLCGNYIKVESTIAALGALAAYYLEQLAIPVVGITGSVGKTSTKEMIAAVLSQKYRTLKTAGNFNNELGLPLTIFRLREEDQIAVLEMGINHFGEMHRLAGIAKPDTCVITNIGQCHLEFLGDRDGVLRAKTEIFDYLRPDGHIILNGDDDKLITVNEVKGIQPTFFGIGTENDIYADQIVKKGLDGIECRICVAKQQETGSFTVLIPIPGIHMVMNALAATAVGLQYGLTFDEIRAGIESLQPVSGRFHMVHTDLFTIIDDCYNANPVSMKASLEVLQDGLNRKVAILGDMGELGTEEEEMHRGVGEFAGGLDIDLCICTGPLSAHIAEGIHAVNPEMKTVVFPNLQTLLAQLSSLICRDDTILVKASHFMHFEKVVAKLEEMDVTG